MIVFDELKYAEDLIKNRKKVKTINYSDAILLTKYFEYKNENYGMKKLLNKLIDYYSKMIPNFHIEQYYKVLEKCVVSAYKYNLRENKEIHITKLELLKINEIDNEEIKKLLFIMLCAAKFYNNNKCLKTKIAEKREKNKIEKIKKKKEQGVYVDYSDKLFLKTISYQDLFKLIKIPYSIEKKNKYMYYLNSNGYINTMSNGSTEIKIYDYIEKEYELSFKCYDDMIYELDFYFDKNDRLKRCSKCKSLFQQTGKNHIYCKICSIENELQKTRLRVEKHRNI